MSPHSSVLSMGLCLTLTYIAHAAHAPFSIRSPRDLGRHRRVVGGAPLGRGAWPWLASLNYLKDHEYLDLQGLDHLCGGTLVGKQWVLTAAHCVHHLSGSAGLGVASNWAVVLGEHDRTDHEATEQRRKVSAIFVYPGYQLFPKLSGDIALLKLDAPVNYTAHVMPISIDTSRKIAQDTACEAGGWGQHKTDDYDEAQYGNGTMTPHVVAVKRVSTRDCQQAYRLSWPLVDEKVVCFDSNSQGDTCKGDSGGPLVCRDDDGRSVLTGVVSVGMGCALEGFPGIYTRASAYKAWMDGLMREAEGPFYVV